MQFRGNKPARRCQSEDAQRLKDENVEGETQIFAGMQINNLEMSLE